MTGTTAAWPCGMGHPGYNLTRSRGPATAEEARRLVRDALAAWHLEDDEETTVLLLSELVANAVRHVYGPLVRILIDRRADGAVYVAVVDRAPRRLPQMRTPRPDDFGGRGLLLVDGLADGWGYDLLGPGLRPWGKRVWATVKVSARQ
ncbi:ATP-binding protein [Streptomyces sp. NPDC055239]